MLIDKSFFIDRLILDSFEEFDSFVHNDKNRIIDFIQLVYNKDSPLVKMYENIGDRIMASVKIAEIPSDSVFVAYLLDQSGASCASDDFENQKLIYNIDDMISCYLSRVCNNNKWEMLVTMQILYWEYTKRLRMFVSITIDEDKALKAMDLKTKITEPAFDLIKKIEQLRIDIFGDYKAVADVAEKKVRKVSPETWATKPNSR